MGTSYHCSIACLIPICRQLQKAAALSSRWVAVYLALRSALLREVRSHLGLIFPCSPCTVSHVLERQYMPAELHVRQPRRTAIAGCITSRCAALQLLHLLLSSVICSNFVMASCRWFNKASEPRSACTASPASCGKDHQIQPRTLCVGYDHEAIRPGQASAVSQ